MLDTFATPLKRKLHDEGTPTSAKRVATPSFLRRCSNLDTITEDASIAPVQPWRRKSFGRSLSSMIQDRKREEEAQRKQVDDEMDEEMEILRAMEQ
jgi:hypothetical protein